MQSFSRNRTRFRVAVALWLASAGGFCAAAPDARQPPSVILISIDTLRADHVGAYGYHRIATPNIDSFARGGTLFANVACQTPLTLPSHTSLFTSTYPFENGIQENAELVPPGAVTLAGVLRSRGYKTAAFIGSVFLERQMGLDQGFDTYDSPFNFEAFSPLSGEMFFGGVENPYSVRDRRDGALVVAAALRWMTANRGQPVFVFIHLFDLHTPYSLPEAAARRKGISRYDAQLEYADEQMGRLKRALAQGGWWDRSLAVLLSDHGEGLGDHGESSHGYFIYQSTLQVPLIFHWPAGFAGQPSRVQRPAGLIDVAPTILDFLRVPAPASFEGTSLLGAAPRAVYSESLHTHDSFGWAPLRSVRLGAYKYIEAPRPELYDLEKDPDERNNIVQRESRPGARASRRTRQAAGALCAARTRSGGRSHTADREASRLSRLSRSRAARASGRLRTRSQGPSAGVPALRGVHGRRRAPASGCGRRPAAEGSRAGRHEHAGAPRSGLLLPRPPRLPEGPREL